jgi:ABC-type phosphate/phosphonate transport system ATPase subunit
MSRLKELQNILRLAQQGNVHLEDLLRRTSLIIAERRKSLNHLLSEIEKQEWDQVRYLQYLKLLEKSMVMIEALRGVQRQEVEVTRKVMESWDERLDRIASLDTMGEPSTSGSMFGEPWLLK